MWQGGRSALWSAPLAPRSPQVGQALVESQPFLLGHIRGARDRQVAVRSRVGILVLVLLNSSSVLLDYWKSSVAQCYANGNFYEDHPDRPSGARAQRLVALAMAMPQWASHIFLTLLGKLVLSSQSRFYFK